MKMRLIITTAVVTIIVIVTVLLLNFNQGWHSHEIKIGAVLPLTGSGANYGVSLKQGIDIAVNEVNHAGGINGVPLRIVYEDSKSEPKTGVSAFNKLVETDNVPVVFGSLSSIILAIQPIADAKKVVLINSSAISPLIAERATDFLFSIMVNGATEARFMAKEFQLRHPNEKIAVFYSNNSSGIDTGKKFVEELHSLGNSNVVSEGYELNTVDFRLLLDRIKKSNVKYGYLIAFSSKEFADILRQTKELGLDLQWFSYSGIETRESLEMAQGAANGVVYSYPKYSPSDALYSKFQEKYAKKYGAWADIYTVTSYDGIHLIAHVMKKYGTKSQEIKHGLRVEKEFEGIFGNVKFSKQGKQFVEKALFWKTVKDNHFVIAE